MIKNKVQLNKKQTIEKSLELSIIDDNLRDLTVDIAELSIDNLLSDGSLKDLPIVGDFAKLYSFGINVQDKLFLKKILSFLNQLKDISPKESKKMMEKINSDKKYRIKVGEKLLYILDSCNDYESSERIGILFRHFLKEKITRLEFEKISFILSTINNNDFYNIIKIGKEFKHKQEKEDFGELVYLYRVSDLLHFGIFDIFYTKPEIIVNANDYPDGFKSIPTNEYVTEIEEEIQGYVKFNDIGRILIEIFDK